MKDGSEVRGESTMFSQTQSISDALSVTYQHILTSEDISNLVGSFTCRVVDGANNIVERTLALNGIYIYYRELTMWIPCLLYII